MPNIRTWNVTSGQPIELKRADLNSERELEEWIEHETSLVNPDLLVVGRQTNLSGRKLRLDLLTIDRFGNYWGVIEIKKGIIKAETIMQAIKYAAVIDKLSPDELRTKTENYFITQNTTLKNFLSENDLDNTIFDKDHRNLVIYVVGTSKDDQLDDIASYLTTNGNEINVVTLELFQNEQGDSVLVRELEELDDEISIANPTSSPSVPRNIEWDQQLEHLFSKAQDNGISEAYEIVYEAATKHGLIPRTYTSSIMYAPPMDKRRFLIFAPINKKQGEYRFQVNAPAFSEFYPISMIRALSVLRGLGFVEATIENAQKIADRLDRLFEIIDNNS